MRKVVLANIESLSLGLMILLLPFQNTIIGATALGFLGKSPSFIFIAIILFLSFLKFSYKIKPVKRISFFVVFYFFVVNFASCICFFGETSYGRPLFIKGLNLLFLNLLFIFPFFYSANFDNKRYKHLILLSFFISIAGVVFGDILHFGFVEYGLFQMSERLSSRPRGFSYEASMLASTIFPLMFSFFCLRNKSKDYSVYAIGIFLVVAVFTSSKGAIVTIILANIFSYVFNRRLFTLKGLFFLIVFSLGVAALSSILIEYFSTDIKNNTSVATRVVCVLTAVFSLLQNPFGVGYFGFLHAFESNISEAIGFVNSMSPVRLNMYEAEGYVTAASDVAIGTKSFFWNNVICFGWPFVILFFLYVFDVVKKCRIYGRKDLELAFWFVIISLFSFVEGIGLYSISLFLAVLSYEIRRNKEIYIKEVERMKENHYVLCK
ncbi:hypothetical protein [uncultured Tolumonas sp.]|uniref:hypothetical protein n=1 Tax=uncultured Tolumonas sp. TaxID=263765 RepID=UPI002A0A2943|nr:hypothetical protein [uncultured Tolumonas sp.]